MRRPEIDEQKGFYIQNILEGPLVICDPPSLKNGLYLDPMNPGEARDLSSYDTQTLQRSAALNNAIRNGYVVVLDEEEYYEQLEIMEAIQREQQEEIERQIVAAEAAGTVFEAEQINLASAGNPHANPAAEALAAQKSGKREKKEWAEAYRYAKDQGLVNSPFEFQELVKKGGFVTGNNRRGRKMSLAEMQNLGVPNQTTMTATKASVAVPGSYHVRGEDGKMEEKGGVYTRKQNLGNFSATGVIEGAEDSSTNAYPGHPDNMKKFANNHEEAEEFVEEVDLEQSDEEYERQAKSKKNQVSERLTPRSPHPAYIGHRR